jgi:DNA polymerase-3 subunit epsilon
LQIGAAGVAVEFDASAPWVDHRIAFIDTETTGIHSATDRLVEVGIVLGQRGEIVDRRSWLIHPGRPIPKEASAIHGISDADVAGARSFAEVADEILAVLARAIPAAYNAAFDRGFLLAELDRAGVRPIDPPPAVRREVDWIDPLTFARELYKQESSRALGDMAARLGVPLENAHRATDDAEAALRVLYALARDARVPRAYNGLILEQRRLERLQQAARRTWRSS